jgi:hypothetical protein
MKGEKSMLKFNRNNWLRLTITLVVLFSGVAMIPYIDLPESPIHWEMFADVYTPDLTADETVGSPGSVFAFTGSGYPPVQPAMIFVNGNQIGTMMIGADGTATFMVDTTRAAPGLYDITFEVDINATATQGIELDQNSSQVNPPSDFTGPTFNLVQVIFFPLLQH